MAKSAEPNSNSSTCAGFHRLASSNDKDRVEINDGLTIVAPETDPAITSLAAEALLRVLLTAAHTRGISPPPSDRP